MKQSRALLEAKVISYSKQYESNRDALANIVSILCSGIFLPFLSNLFFTKTNFLFLWLHEPLRKIFWEERIDKVMQIFPDARSLPVLKWSMTNPEVLSQFEQDIRSMMLHWPDFAGMIVLRNANVSYANINVETYAEEVGKIPHLLADLTAGERHHILFYVATLIDLLYTWKPDLRLINRYHNMFSFLAPFVPDQLSSEQQAQFPEYTGPGSTFATKNCTRYAELIQLMLPFYFSEKFNMEQGASPFVLARFTTRLFWVGIGLASFGNSFIIKPLLNKVIRAPKFNFLGLDRCFGENLEIKNYRLLSYQKLVVEKNKLKKSLATQNYYVNKSKIVERILIIMTIGYYIFNLLKRGWSDEIFAIVPMFCCLVKNTVVDTLETWRLTRGLDSLENQLESILKPCQTEYQIVYRIEKNNRGKLVNSYVTIQIYKSQDGDSKHNFSEKNFVSVIKSVLNYFHISMNTHDDTNILLAANTVITAELKDYFKCALQAAVLHHQIGQQIKSILKSKPHVHCDLLFSDPLKPEWIIEVPETVSDSKLNLKGVSTEHCFIKIARKSRFNDLELRQLDKMLTQVILEQKPLPQNNENSLKKGRKISSADQADLKQPDLPKKSSKPSPKTIVWPSVNAQFPDGKITQISNSPHRFMNFTLPVSAFGTDSLASKTRKSFYDKSMQLAREKTDSQGIKHGNYLGTNYTGQQHMFPARIKLLGNHGNEAVLLSIYSAPTGQLLYQTAGYSPNFHP